MTMYQRMAILYLTLGATVLAVVVGGLLLFWLDGGG